MYFSADKKQRVLLLAVCCAIIVSGLAFLVIAPGIGFPTGIGRPGHSVANLYFIPAGEWKGLPLGTCGPDTVPLAWSTDIEPAYGNSFLQEFGEPEPALHPEMPPLMHYPVRKQAIDALMERARIPVPEDSVIGLYEFSDSRLLLIQQDTNITEILQTGEAIRTYTLTPVLVGSRNIGADETGYAKHGAYNFSSEHVVAIRRIDLVLPSTENETFPLYIVNKTRTEHICYPDGSPLASISTTGMFYVIYGQRVELVVSGSVITLDPQWTLCSEKAEISGEEGAMDQLKHTVKLARSSERMLQSHLVSTSAHIQVHEADMGSTDQWVSRDSTGCSC